MLGSPSDDLKLMPMQSSDHPRRIAVIPIDDVGKAVLEEAVNVLKAAAAAGKRAVTLTPLSWCLYGSNGALPENAANILSSGFDAVVIGPAADPQSTSPHRPVIDALKKSLRLEAQERSCLMIDKRTTSPRLRSEKDIQFVVISDPGDGISNSQKLLFHAFEFARQWKLNRITVTLDSKSTLNEADLIFMAELRSANPGIQALSLGLEQVIRGLIHNPAHFQVIIALGSCAAAVGALAEELAGGPGLTPVATVSRSSLSLFGPSGGISDSNPAYANPVGAVLAVAIMFDRFGWEAEAKAVRDAVRGSLHEQQSTPDIGGQLNTRELGNWLTSATLIRSRSC